MSIVRQIMVAVDSVGWTAVVAPSPAKTVIFDNSESGGYDILRRIDSANADTEKVIPYGSQAVWKLDTNQFFDRGATVAYLKSTTGSFDVAVEFLT